MSRLVDTLRALVPLLCLASAAFLIQGANRLYNALQHLASGLPDGGSAWVSGLITKGAHSMIWAGALAAAAVLAALYLRSRTHGAPSKRPPRSRPDQHDR